MAFDLKKSITSAIILLLLGIPRLVNAQADSNRLEESENQVPIPGSHGLMESITDFSESHKFNKPSPELSEKDNIIQKSEDITRVGSSESQLEKKAGFFGSESDSQTDEMSDEKGSSNKDVNEDKTPEDGKPCIPELLSIFESLTASKVLILFYILTVVISSCSSYYRELVKDKAENCTMVGSIAVTLYCINANDGKIPTAQKVLFTFLFCCLFFIKLTEARSFLFMIVIKAAKFTVIVYQGCWKKCVSTKERVIFFVEKSSYKFSRLVRKCRASEQQNDIEKCPNKEPEKTKKKIKKVKEKKKKTKN